LFVGIKKHKEREASAQGIIKKRGIYRGKGKEEQNCG